MTYDTILSSFPKSGLGHDSNWLFSPKPLHLDKKTVKFISQLGHPLAQFQKASDHIYQRSAQGKLPSWIHELLDAGKPEWVIQAQRAPNISKSQPKVIRPDLILTGNEETSSFAMTELDSVPGGMGITLWLSQFYSGQGFKILGGADGIAKGFQSVFNNPEDGSSKGNILISQESEDYRQEMEWLAQQCSDITLSSAEAARSIDASTYRFFEWFDWKNIPAAQKLASSPLLSSPCKPHLEEKLWLALLWSPSLKPIWQQALRANHLERLRDITPYSWVIDPIPLPPNAALPRLDAHSWNEVANFSQKQRELVLKVSGFSELAWGSRGVYIGHDMPAEQWANQVDQALLHHDSQPRMMQQFHHGKIIKHPYFDPETGEEKVMLGRARLCPYYFTNDQGETSLGGCLATIVPADKKKIHGMSDAILVPCSA